MLRALTVISELSTQDVKPFVLRTSLASPVADRAPTRIVLVSHGENGRDLILAVCM